jgi:tetratricopeptide (TPR) repeat protein
LWWGGRQIFLKAAEKAVLEKSFVGTTFYLGIANTLGNAMALSEAIKDTTLATIHIRSILEFDKFVKSHPSKGFKYTSKFYQNDGHSSVPLIAEYDALHFIFDKYPFELSGKDYDDASIDVAHNYALHYHEVSGQFGYIVKPPENIVNSMGYEFLQMQQYKKAEGLFKMNVSNYPESFSAYNSYGDYFVAIGEMTKAIENFKKALSIREYPESRQKLDKLLK